MSCLGHGIALLVRTLGNTETSVGQFPEGLHICDFVHEGGGVFVEAPSEFVGGVGDYEARPPERYLSTLSGGKESQEGRRW